MANENYPIWDGKEKSEDVTQLGAAHIENILRLIEARLASGFADNNPRRREFMIWWHGILTLEACYRNVKHDAGIDNIIAPPSDAYETRMALIDEWSQGYPMPDEVRNVGDK